MEIIFPHSVEYQVSRSVPIEEIIGTLEAQQRAIERVPDILEELIYGLHVQRVELRVQSIEISSLKEAFFVGLFLTYQKELEKEIPAAIESWLNIPVEDKHKTLVTVAVVLLLYYGADYAYRRLTDHLGSAAINRKVDELVAEIAALSKRPDSEVRKIIERQLSKKGRLKEMAKAAIKFFRPSRSQDNAPIKTAGSTLKPPDIADVPNQVDLSALDF